MLLGANVAFLAISSVDNSASSPHRSPEQIMSYVSTVFSLASYLVCWILVQRHAPAIGESAAAGVRQRFFPSLIVFDACNLLRSHISRGAKGISLVLRLMPSSSGEITSLVSQSNSLTGSFQSPVCALYLEVRFIPAILTLSAHDAGR